MVILPKSVLKEDKDMGENHLKEKGMMDIGGKDNKEEVLADIMIAITEDQDHILMITEEENLKDLATIINDFKENVQEKEIETGEVF